MADEQYQALARIIDKPIRRWWRSIGIWWLAAFAVVLLIEIAAKLYEHTLVLHARPVVAFVVELGSIYLVQYNILALILYCAMLQLMLVATFSIRQICEAEPIFRGPRLYHLSFRVVVRILFPLLALLYLLSFARYFHYMSLYEIAHLGDQPALLVELLDNCIALFLIPALLILWIAALAVMPQVPRWNLWLAMLLQVFLPSFAWSSELRDLAYAFAPSSFFLVPQRASGWLYCCSDCSCTT